ncbi:thiamine phosphate synthase [Devosia sp.]|uniref:thiamine phosphate synthase n=1 Tax=Devosia sp. TaxID=1871048 RepID=UPI002AFF334F|nr:thiamine phosphate synthase [Devosia sp.]
MAPQLYLITPTDAAPESFPNTLMRVLSAGEFAAILVARGERDAAAYEKLAAAIIHVGQGAGCAVLLEDDAHLARRLGADGVHVTAGPAALKAAIAALKPAMIVGAGHLSSRHDAMTAGEMDVDYVFFGPVAGPADPRAPELAQWWAQTFEIPAVLSLPAAAPGARDAGGVEFLALSQRLWAAPDPAAALRALLPLLEGAS